MLMKTYYTETYSLQTHIYAQTHKYTNVIHINTHILTLSLINMSVLKIYFIPRNCNYYLNSSLN